MMHSDNQSEFFICLIEIRRVIKQRGLKGAYVSFLICLIEIWRVIKQRGLKGVYVSYYLWMSRS